MSSISNEGGGLPITGHPTSWFTLLLPMVHVGCNRLKQIVPLQFPPSTLIGFEVEVSNIGLASSNSDLIIITLGNVTTTTVNGLQPSLTYSFRVRALVEPLDGDWRNIDAYGRRSLIPGFLRGEFSDFSTGMTLGFDISLPAFTAQSARNATPSDVNATGGPRGQWGPEDHHGLSLVGSAHI